MNLRGLGAQSSIRGFPASGRVPGEVAATIISLLKWACLSTMVAYMESARPSPVGGVADDLAAVRALRDHADRLEEASVERALKEGWSWPQVAEALGVTRQAVHKKFSRRLAGTDVPLRRRPS